MELVLLSWLLRSISGERLVTEKKELKWIRLGIRSEAILGRRLIGLEYCNMQYNP